MQNKEVKTESKSLHTKGEWAQRNLEIIGPYGSNKSICEMTGNYMDESEALANADKIVKCVNSHDELVQNLTRLIDRIEESNLQNNFPSAYNRAKEALSKATN